jgi:hypothetical protein
MSPTGARYLVIDNETWTVYENPKSGPPHYGPALVFEDGKFARRVRNFPREWRELPDAELYSLSWSR